MTLRQKQSEYNRRYEAKNPERARVLRQQRVERRRPKGLEYAKARSRQRSELLSKLKLQRGCVDCGYCAHPAALDFDHIRDKSAEIAALRTCALDRLLAEIAKCEVVCANCHRVRTETRRKGRAA